MKITVTDLNARDEIMIRTQFSAYNFRVTDPAKRRGFLSGGPLGNQPHDAFFAGAIPAGFGRPRKSNRLETGCRAVFLVATKCLDRVTTSIITEINLSAAA